MTVFYGYNGQVWAVCLAALNDLTTALQTASSPFATLPLAQQVSNTMLNALAAINANRISYIWSGATSSLVAAGSLPISPSASDALYFNNRIDALQAAQPALAALIPTPSLVTVSSSLLQGLPAMPDIGLLEYLAAFDYETPPAGLTLNNLPTYATNCANAFADIAVLIAGIQGINQNYLYDVVSQFSQLMNSYSEFLGCFLGFTGDLGVLWNQMFVLPTLLAYADLVAGAPNSLATQQDQLIRFLIINAMQQVNNFILSAEKPVAQEILQAVVMTGDTMMDIAARSLNDFEQWTQIAVLNNLSPPYIGATPQPGLAGWGSKVLLPTPNGPPPGGIVPNYLINFLGVDIYFGPINGDMPAWTGDFQLISGYNNLRWALGRRMQTTLGALIFHPDYGCRIPPEIGNIQTSDTAGYIAAFGKSCLLSDPRVASVPQAFASLLPNFSVQFDGTVQAAGFASTPVVINEVINSSLTSTTVTQG